MLVSLRAKLIATSRKPRRSMHLWKQSNRRWCSLSSCPGRWLPVCINTPKRQVKRSAILSRRRFGRCCGEGAVAERRQPTYRVQLEYCSDRLQVEKLRQAYLLLVPERRGEIPNQW